MIRAHFKRLVSRVVVLLICGVSCTWLVTTGNGDLPLLSISQAIAEDKPAADNKAKDTAKAKEQPEDRAVALDLSSHVQYKAESFKKSTSFPWQGVPQGDQVMNGIPLKIAGCVFLFGKKNQQRLGQTLPEKVGGIEVKKKFETLYVYHTAFFEGKPGSPVYDVVFNYADGTSKSETILCIDDVRDWFINDPDEVKIGPSGKRSTLAWKGDGMMNNRKQGLRFCLTAVENPNPKLEVTTIDLVSSKGDTAGVILSLTPGKSGLMSLPKESPAKPDPKAETKTETK